MHTTTIGVDLAKEVIQVCVVQHGKMLSNTEMMPGAFAAWLSTQRPAMVVFEACSTSNYWKQKATACGHDAQLISAKLVASIRQNQKTDKNDALAIVQASQLTDIQFIKGKNFSQQELQSISKMRELAVRQKVALTNQITALLLEFNIRVSPKSGGLAGVVQTTLEDAENGFSMAFRDALSETWQALLAVHNRIARYDTSLAEAIEANPDCKKLLALESVSSINAVHLYTTLACGDENLFTSARDASACIGLTPVQYSSGGQVKLGAISRKVKNSLVRSHLISGAMAVIHQVVKREPKTAKEQWLKALVERRGKKCAAVALANKTVRTAYAMLRDSTEYRAQPIRA
ncbi:IS110 family transposase [Marinobacterium litorale]|uniref:IS110 family transposase n=1 Tax=Marinobacterium litorale TaxID=404770 RepID=UPI000417F83D|nr:IS110 family transposase [Marinobacterium litorale]